MDRPEIRANRGRCVSATSSHRELLSSAPTRESVNWRRWEHPHRSRCSPPILKRTAHQHDLQSEWLRFHYDLNSGQKTGAFLDQRQNYLAAAEFAHGDALDICCYQGGFALHLARVCERVTGIDASRAALEVADQNLALNPGLKAEVDWMEANAFDLLRDWSSEGPAYDTIVLDPPAFAKSVRAVEGALQGLQRAQSKGDEAASARRDADHLLLLPPCIRRGFHRHRLGRGRRCRSQSQADRAPGRLH